MFDLLFSNLLITLTYIFFQVTLHSIDLPPGPLQEYQPLMRARNHIYTYIRLFWGKELSVNRKQIVDGEYIYLDKVMFS